MISYDFEIDEETIDSAVNIYRALVNKVMDLPIMLNFYFSKDHRKNMMHFNLALKIGSILTCGYKDYGPSLNALNKGSQIVYDLLKLTSKNKYLSIYFGYFPFIKFYNRHSWKAFEKIVDIFNSLSDIDKYHHMTCVETKQID